MNKKRILIFNVNWLGDVLFSTAVIRNIRRNYPDSFIACVVPERCLPILEGNPRLDEIIIFDEKDTHKGLLEKLKFIRLLKSRKFDAVFLLHRSFSRALICRLAGIPERIGHYTKKRAFLLTKSFIPPAADSLHRLNYYLDIIEKAGLEVQDRYTEFFINKADEEFIAHFLDNVSVGKDDRLIGINPGGNWLPKRWPAGHWAELSDALIRDFGFKVIITGGGSDMPLVEEIKGLMKEKPILSAGALNIKQLAALCRRVDLFITADTGPLHIANAVGAKKIIALFGPTDPLVTGPFPADNVIILKKDPGCRIPCYEAGCKDNKCMKAITVEDVLGKIKHVK